MDDKNKYPNQPSFEQVTGGLTEHKLFGLMCDLRDLSEMGITGNQGAFAQGLPHVAKASNMENDGLNKVMTVETFDQHPNQPGATVLRRTTFSAMGAQDFDIVYEDLEHGTVLTGKSRIPIKADADTDVGYKTALWFVPEDQWEALRLIQPDVARQKAEAQVKSQRTGRGVLRSLFGKRTRR